MNSTSIVIVDDNQVNLSLFEALVKKLGPYEPRCFLDARAGLAWVQAHEAALVIVDYMMPDLDGIGFVEALRATPGRSAVPILMVTANDQKQVRYRALNAGATDFLNKPVDRVEFMARVANLLALSEAQWRLAHRAEWLADEVRKATVEIEQRELETVVRLSKAAEYRDPETGAHILRMAHYSQLIAKGLGMPEDEQALLLQAAPLHDIGKVGIADAILLKPGPLTPEEFEVMKRHTQHGYDILQGSSAPLLQLGAVIALGHHERFDGSGYPGGLRAQDIPLTCRIVAVADVFDALTSARPYKPAWTLEAASNNLRTQAGSHFDPECVAVFFDHWQEVLDIRERFSDEEDWSTMLSQL